MSDAPETAKARDRIIAGCLAFSFDGWPMPMRAERAKMRAGLRALHRQAPRDFVAVFGPIAERGFARRERERRNRAPA